MTTNVVMKSMDVIAGRYLVVKGPAEDRTLRGGFGAVYLCADQRDEGRPVALKTFQPQFLSDRAARGRFLREADIWVRLGRHPNIVRAHEVLHVGDGREIYIVMEWVAAAAGKRGASLREWLRARKPLPSDQTLRWALQIVRGLKHASTIVPQLAHRDLKPENVLIGRTDQAAVTDFGLATTVAQAGPAAFTISGQERGQESALAQATLAGGGTPEYMAPEQWERDTVDLRADMYALGCLVVEMLTGEMPVKAVPREACRALHHAGRALAAAEAIQHELPGWLVRCLAVRPENRYPTWEALEADLETAYIQLLGRPAPVPLTSDELTTTERVRLGWSLNAIGVSYVDLGQYEEASNHFNGVIRSGTLEFDKGLEAAVISNLGTVCKVLGDVPRALECFRHALTAAREIGAKDCEGQILDGLGLAYLTGGDVASAIAHFEQSRELARQVGDRASEAATLGNLGIAYSTLGSLRRTRAHHEQAREYHEQALSIAREIGDRVAEGRALGNLGVVCKALGQLDQAVGYYEQDLVIARELANRSGEGSTLGNLGNIHVERGDFRQALDCYQRSLTIVKESGDVSAESTILCCLGNIYSQLGQVVPAYDHYEHSLAVAREAGYRLSEAATLFSFAGFLAERRQEQVARTYAEAALHLFREIGHDGYAERAELLLHRLGRPEL